MWRVIASATIEDGIAIVPFGRGEFLAGVRLGGEGDVTNSTRIWEKQGRGGCRRADAGRPGWPRVCAERRGPDHLPRHQDRRRNLVGRPAPKPQQVLFVAGAGGRQALLRARRWRGLRRPRGDDGFELLAENDMGETIIADARADSRRLLDSRPRAFVSHRAVAISRLVLGQWIHSSMSLGNTGRQSLYARVARTSVCVSTSRPASAYAGLAAGFALAGSAGLLLAATEVVFARGRDLTRHLSWTRCHRAGHQAEVELAGVDVDRRHGDAHRVAQAIGVAAAEAGDHVARAVEAVVVVGQRR